MSTLKLIQTTNDGRVKTWKLTPTGEWITFGCSRKARLNSIDNSVPSFESVIEYRNSEWHYISFATESQNSDVLIEQGQVISLQSSKLKFEFFTKKLDILASLNQIQSNGAVSKKIIIVTKNNKLMGVHVT
ncbi:MAG: hypothetical protein ABL930_12415, partial [Pseudobdellovibrio sp.]